jgi:DNA-binding response OmpR family regulator
VTEQDTSNEAAGRPPGPALFSGFHTMLCSPDTEGSGAQNEPRGRVLIVEDEYFVALISEGALSEAGFVVVGMAATQEQAIELAGTERPDVVLMDIRLGGTGDGVAIAAEILARFDIPSLFATARADATTRNRGDQVGPLGWLLKPFTPAEVVSAIGAAIDLARQRSKERKNH